MATPDLVHVRIIGSPALVEAVARRLRKQLVVALESSDLPTRGGGGVRRYLTAIASVDGQAEPAASAEEGRR